MITAPYFKPYFKSQWITVGRGLHYGSGYGCGLGSCYRYGYGYGKGNGNGNGRGSGKSHYHGTTQRTILLNPVYLERMGVE
jgi:hypothetical protein